jgi:hypothetical protein
MVFHYWCERIAAIALRWKICCEIVAKSWIRSHSRDRSLRGLNSCEVEEGSHSEIIRAEHRNPPTRSDSSNKDFPIAPETEQRTVFVLRPLRARRVCSSAMDRSRVATINLVYSISHAVVSKQIYLTQYGLMAESHWREFRPNMVRGLEEKGTLMDALFEAQERTIGEMEALTRKLETEQNLTPQQAHDRAWEMIREKYILLTPEENL